MPVSYTRDYVLSNALTGAWRDPEVRALLLGQSAAQADPVPLDRKGSLAFDLRSEASATLLEARLGPWPLALENTGAEGVACLDPMQLRTLTLALRIPAASLTTGEVDRDLALLGEAFLDVHEHPYIALTADAARNVTATGAVLDGELSVRGTTIPVAVEVSYRGVDLDDEGRQRVRLEVHAAFSRRDLDLGNDCLFCSTGRLLRDEMQLHVDVEAIVPAATTA